MPTSRPEVIPVIARQLLALKPNSILDVGIGFGLYGGVVREYLEVSIGRRPQCKDWQVQLVGIEIWSDYRNSMWQLYNKVLIGNALDLVPNLGWFDVVLLIDIIEHFEPCGGKLLLDHLSRQTKTLLISTPAWENSCAPFKQGVTFGNPFEQHRAFWTKEMLSEFGNIGYSQKTADGTLVVRVDINNISVASS